MGSKSSKKKEAKVNYKKTLKFVMLGIPASGKSTFSRQMRILHESAWTEQELQVHYDIIASNVYDGLKELANAITKDETAKLSSKTAKLAKYYKELTTYPAINAEELEKANSFWKDSTVQAAITSIKSEMTANLAYFMSRLDVISKPEYLPSSEDIMHARQRSVGSVETIFVLDKTRYILTDMGGHKPERAKWERVIADGCRALFFFVAVDEYDTPSPEDKEKTKLKLSMETWKGVLTNPKVANINIVLVFNKIDLLERNLALGFDAVLKQFPKYSGEKTKAGYLAFLKKQYFNLIPKSINMENVTHFNMCAIDAALSRKIFEDARQQISLNAYDFGM